MTSALMEAEDSSINLENNRIAGLEAQILSSQESMVRLNRELDSALLRITTLENVCSETQMDLHEKRRRIKELNDEINEREEINERLIQELNEKDEKLQNLNELTIQLKEHIKQKAEENVRNNNQYEFLFDEYEDSSIDNLRSQIQFDRQLRELILDNHCSFYNSPQDAINKYHQNQYLKFHDLLQKSLVTEDISQLIDSDDILFELLTHLNSLSRLKETLSQDSKQLQYIRSLLHLPIDNYEEFLQDLINKRECIEYLRSKIDNANDHLRDFDFIKHILHEHFNYQQQQIELKEYLQINNDNNDNDLDYSHILMERYNEANHIKEELNEKIKIHEEFRNQFDEILSKFSNQSIDQNLNEDSPLDRLQFILQSKTNLLQTSSSDEKQSEQLIIDELNKLKEELNEKIKIHEEFRNQFDEILSKFSNQSIDQNLNEDSPLDRLQFILQSKTNLLQTSSSDAKQSEQLIIDELNKLKEEVNYRKNQLKEITNSLGLDNDDEETLLNLINFHLALRKKFSSIDNNESILQRIDDYQLIIKTLNSSENNWTNETTNELVSKLQTMINAENIIEDLQNRLDQSIANENHIKQITDEFIPNTDIDEESNITRIHNLLQSLINFRQNIFDKTQMNTEEDIYQLIEKSQDEFYLKIKELIDIEEDQPEIILNKIKELSEISQIKINEDEQLRNILNIKDNNIFESVIQLNENYHHLLEEHEKLLQKENIIDQSIERMRNTIGLSSNSSSRTQIDEICNIFDTFSLEYCQLTSTNIETMNLMKILKQIQLFYVENNQLKTLIDQIDSAENSDHISKLQTYLTKVDSLCQLISNNDNINIDQALITYQTKIKQDNDTIEKISDFKQQLLIRLSIEDEEEIFDRLDEIQHINNDLIEKQKNFNNSTITLTSLNTTVSQQQTKILEYEETLEKIRLQRERMLSKMKEMKTNNELLATELKQANQSIDEYHRKEIDYKNEVEELKQKLRSTNSKIQVTLDDCQTQQDLQETMKLEIESLKNEIDKQKKFYENRCRQIINEKKQLEKNTKEYFEQKQIVEDENKQLQTLLQTIKDSLENVDDIHSIVDAILKLHQDLLILHQNNERIQIENDKLLLNISQQETTINEYIQIKIELERRLIDNEQQINNFQKQIKQDIEQYENLQNEFHLYKEDEKQQQQQQQIKTNQSVTITNIEQSPPHVQQKDQSTNWMAIDIKDEEIPLTTTATATTIANKHLTIDTPAALLNLLGELKSKLGITLTHRPRSSSVFFLYLCIVHLLTIYLLFIRHC